MHPRPPPHLPAYPPPPFPLQGTTGEVYNIGTEKERTVNEVALEIARYFKMDEAKVVHVKDRAFNDR